MAHKTRVCPKHGCPELVAPNGECPQHPRVPWVRQPADRRSDLSGWEQQRRARAVIQRDRGICYVCHQPGANEADHVIPISQGGADAEHNMAAIHSTPCHHNKTKLESHPPGHPNPT